MHLLLLLLLLPCNNNVHGFSTYHSYNLDFMVVLAVGVNNKKKAYDFIMRVTLFPVNPLQVKSLQVFDFLINA